jgi:hypothetical protein
MVRSLVLVFACSALFLACAGTDGVSIGSAPPDAGSAPSSVYRDLPPLPVDDDGGGALDFTVPVGLPDAGTAMPPVAPPPGDPIDALRDACVTAINQYRQGIGAGPVQRWTAAEACADAQAHIDAAYVTSHQTFRQCAELGQNECPSWGGATGAQALSSCLQSQWDTRPNGDLFRDMISTQWTHVACGFYRTGDGHWWVVQNFR